MLLYDSADFNALLYSEETLLSFFELSLADDSFLDVSFLDDSAVETSFSFDGRIRRIEYFLSGIVGGIVTWIAMLLGVGTFIFGASSGSAGGSVFGLLIGLAALVASVWFSLAQGVKRLHDLNKSGWLILLMFIPIVNAIFGLYMLFADGTVGPNQYGADPKNRMPYQGQPSAVNVTVNVSREDVKVEKPVEAAPAPAETPAKEKAE